MRRPVRTSPLDSLVILLAGNALSHLLARGFMTLGFLGSAGPMAVSTASLDSAADIVPVMMITYWLQVKCRARSVVRAQMSQPGQVQPAREALDVHADAVSYDNPMRKSLPQSK